MARKIAASLVWDAAAAGLIRLACAYGDLTRDDHDHRDCVRDDISYAADLQLRLVAAIVTGDEDAILERLESLREAIEVSSG